MGKNADKVTRMEKLLFIYNGKAGRQKIREKLAVTLDAFASCGYEITVRPTQCRGDAAIQAAGSAGYDRVVCCGGDGTLNEVVTGLMKLPEELRPALGYIPAGSTNDFARNLDLPRGAEEAARMACSGQVRPCDLGAVDGRYFTYVAAFGLFTDVSYSTPQATKNLLGHFAYLLEGAGRLGNIPAFHVRAETDEGEVHEGDYIYGMVSNTISVGGVVNLPRDKVRLDDGRFEGILIRRPRTAKDWQDILSALTTQKVGGGDMVTAFSAHRVTFSGTEEIAWTLDGEFGGKRRVTEIQNLPGAIALACGPKAVLEG